MMLRTLTLLVTCSAVTLGQGPAGATPSRPISVVVSGGLTVPAGKLKDLHDTGFHYDVAVLVTPPHLPFAFRPELSLTRFQRKDLTTAATGSGYGTGDTEMLAALGNLELPLGGGLYALAGGGLLRVKAALASTTTGSDLTQSRVAFDIGGGARFRLGGIRGFVEGRFGAASYDQGKVGFDSARLIPITFGLVF